MFLQLWQLSLQESPTNDDPHKNLSEFRLSVPFSTSFAHLLKYCRKFSLISGLNLTHAKRTWLVAAVYKMKTLYTTIIIMIDLVEHSAVD